MKIEDFIIQTDLLSKKEIEKVKLLTYFYSKTTDQTQFHFRDIVEWFESLDLGLPNKSRLFSNIRDSKNFVKGSSKNSFKIHARTKSNLDELYVLLLDDKTTINHISSILPESLFNQTRQYIETISAQINSSYENNIYDGCAVLMRRLIEILLILSFKNFGVEQSIKTSSGNYAQLKKIIDTAKQDNDLDLSRNAKECLESFRELGNFSAHKLHYTCKPQYIEEVKLNYRVTIEELLYKSGLKR